MKPEQKTEQKAKFYHALGDKTRLKIIEFLLKHECECICHIADYTKKDQSTIFRHIEILKNAGLIETKKEDKFLFCSVKNKEELNKLLDV